MTQDTNFTCSVCKSPMQKTHVFREEIEICIIHCTGCDNSWKECIECHADMAAHGSNICEHCIAEYGENEQPDIFNVWGTR